MNHFLQGSKRKHKIPISKTIQIYLIMLPGLAYLLVNNYMPMFGLVIAFKNIDYSLGILKSPWAGLSNFKFLFTSGNAMIITRNTLLYNGVFIVLGMIVGVALAIFLNEIRSKFASRFYQTLILLPYLMSYVVVSYLAYAFLNQDTGFINNTILPLLGIDTKISFYMIPKYWPFILTFVNLWKGMGFGCVIYFSSIIGIPAELFEAAKMDGATKLQQIRFVTIPSLVPIMITMFILNISKIFYSDFGLFYQVPKNSGMLYSVTQTIDTFVYNALMTQNNIGMSSAAGFYQSIVGFVLVIVANALIRRISRENAMF